MRLQICHLSDIHFLDKNNSLISKQESLCRAILESSFKNEKILFLISGDIHIRKRSALKEAQEKVYKKLQDENIKQDEALDIKMIWNQIKMGMEEINNQMDNIFGLMSYTTIRRLSNSVGNETLKTLLLQGGNLDSLSYELIKNSTFLNEYGIIRPQEIIDFHKQLKKDKNIFAENLLRLLVYEHYYVFGSKDLKTRQKIWHEFNFDNDQNKSMLLNNIS